MNEHKAYYFSDANGNEEFIVISSRSEAEVVEEFGDGFDKPMVLELNGNATVWPCDRKLIRE